MSCYYDYLAVQHHKDTVALLFPPIQYPKHMMHAPTHHMNMIMNTDTRYIVGLTNIEPTYTINHTIGSKKGDRGKDKKRRANHTCRNWKKWGGVVRNSNLCIQ